LTCIPQHTLATKNLKTIHTPWPITDVFLHRNVKLACTQSRNTLDWGLFEVRKCVFGHKWHRVGRTMHTNIYQVYRCTLLLAGKLLQHRCSHMQYIGIRCFWHENYCKIGSVICGVCTVLANLAYKITKHAWQTSTPVPLTSWQIKHLKSMASFSI
jgi:hypothetical protein